MSDANQQALVEWLARHGVTAPRDELRKTRADLEGYRRKRERAAATMSARVREGFEHEVAAASSFPADESWPAFRKALAAETRILASRARTSRIGGTYPSSMLRRPCRWLPVCGSAAISWTN